MIVTSRTEETWLGTSLRRVPVGGLVPTEAIEYADQLLAAYPDAAPRRSQRAFAELMEWLNGHPLSMRVILPYLDTTDSQELLAGLRGTAALPGRDLLAASLTYSIDHLTPDTRRLLAAVSLFQSVTDANVLSFLSKVPDVPRRFHGHTAYDWARALDQAAGVGLLTPLGRDMYGIHPALPAHLAEQWRLEEPDDYDHQRAVTQAALLEAYALSGKWLLQQIHGGASAVAFAVIDHHRRMLGSMLGYALEHGLWSQALAIADPLNDYWDSRGLTEEAVGWVDRTRLALEAANGTPPPLDDPAGALWLFFVGSQAGRQITARQLDAAERTHLDMAAMLQQQPESPQQLERLAVTYHELGRVAQARGRLDDAQRFYHECLTISEKLGNKPGIAGTYHQLGTVAQDRGRPDDAQLWHHKSLTINEELNDRPRIAGNYHQLGTVAQAQGNLDKAEEWLRKSVTIKEELGNRPRAAKSYRELGIVVQLRGRLDEAEEWYLKSLTINEELNDRPGIAENYRQLGTVAQDRGRLDEAEEWYLRSLAISEKLGNRLGMAASFGHMGLLAEDRGHYEEAMEWMIRCVALFDEFPHPATDPGHLARLTALLGIDALNLCWQRVTGKTLPPVISDVIASALAQRAT